MVTGNTLVMAQTVGLTLIFLSEIIMGTLPMHSPSFRSSKLLMGWANSFAAGVFLAVGIVHLLPEAVEKMDEYYGNLTKELPIAFLMVILGYTVILMLERVMFAGHEADDVASKDVETSREPTNASTTSRLLDAEAAGKRSMSVVSAVEGSGRSSNNSATYMLLFALTVHGITEGLALGLQTSLSSAWPLWLAIFTHNWAEALCLGVTFASSSVPIFRATVFMTMFSLATPLGIAMGMLLHVVLADVTVAYFMAFSCGTFLYFGATEVVVEEFTTGQTNWVKFGWFCLGIALMVFIKVYVE
eukprot:EG_transcript_12956